MRELQLMAENGDIPEDALIDTLQAVTGEFNEKAKQVAFVIQNMGAPIPAIDAQIARLQAMQKSIQSREEWLKNYLLSNMMANEISEISCDYFKIKVVSGRESVVVDNMDLLPDEFVRVKTEIAPDKIAISKAIKNGSEVSGARLERSAPSLQIK
jgi:phage host-nuclease inhibitor protein Gam